MATGTLAPLLVKLGSLSLGEWRPSDGGSAPGSAPCPGTGSERTKTRRISPAATSPTAAGTTPRKLRLDSRRGREAGGGLIADPNSVPVGAPVGLGPPGP